MRIIAVDDERPALESLVKAIRAARPDSEVFAFMKPAEAEAFARENECDAAFLDIQMRGVTGLALAKRIKEISPDVGIVFVTGFSEYALDAFSLHASGYIMKPVTEQSVSDELRNLRRPAQDPVPQRLTVQCFGSFEVFFDGAPMVFRYAKTKELFAYLVDRRGAVASSDELLAVLWDDRPVTPSLRSQLRNSATDLARALKQAGEPELLLRSGRGLAVDPGRLDCDYYRFLRGDPAAVNAYRGEYMSRYSWAELTLGSISE